MSENRLGEFKIDIDDRAVATVMAVSGGYPGNFETGFEIDGLDVLNEDDVMVFQAGTTNDDGRILTKGGRVLTVTAYGATIPDAVKRSLKIMEFISFEGMYYRKDIGYEFS
jgi:phosphoribosylamine---glycine ligase